MTSFDKFTILNASVFISQYMFSAHKILQTWKYKIIQDSVQKENEWFLAWHEINDNTNLKSQIFLR